MNDRRLGVRWANFLLWNCLEHEKVKIKTFGRDDLIRLIIKIPNSLAAGYDIRSFEKNGNHKHIEVKTSVSRSKLINSSFHMTTNEWSAANTLKDTYYVYRLMISKNEVSLFVICNPVGKYKDDFIDMTPRDGADISYSSRSGNWEKLLI